VGVYAIRHGTAMRLEEEHWMVAGGILIAIGVLALRQAT
jgi:hypothetical protein